MNEESAENPRGKRTFVSLANLSLDPNNFRIVDHPDYRVVESDNAFDTKVQRRTESIILGHNQENVRDLIASIKANGWLDLDPILVERRSGKNLVLEGNRRVATLRHLQRRYKDASIDLGKLDPAIFSRVPIIFHEFADESQQLAMMGLHHISGKRRWPAVNRAIAIRRLQEHFRDDADAVCNVLGMSKREFNLSSRTLALVEAYKKSDYGDQFRSGQFNLFREIIQSVPIREWLHWNQQVCEAGNTINLERLFRWMSRDIGQEPSDNEEASDLQTEIEPVLTTVSHIRELAKIIDDPDAVKRLDETRSLQEATISSRFLAKSEIGRAFAMVDNGIQKLSKRVGDFEEEDLQRIDQLIGKLQGLALAHKRHPLINNDRLPWLPFNEFTESQFSRLQVVQYRGIGGLELNDLKRVNLIVGVNNSGKTSLLEAIYLLSRQNDENALLDVIRWRGRFEEHPGNLWLAEQIPDDTRIEGNFDEKSNNNNENNVTCLDIKRTTEPDEEMWDQSTFLAKLMLNSRYGGQSQHTNAVFYSNLRRRVNYSGRHWLCRSAFTSPFWISRTEALAEANKAALKAGTKTRVIQFIKKRVDDKIENIELADKYNRFIVSHSTFNPAPDLSTFGDGMRRIFEICLLLVGVRGGVLLIDEFENAIHRDLLIPFTVLVQELAEDLNVQVFLTTHSKEAFDAFIENGASTDGIAAFAIGSTEGGVSAQRFGGGELSRLLEALDIDLRGLK